MKRRATSAKRGPESPARASSAASRIHALVRIIPRGQVVTYGELAALAGIASGHRVAARAMRDCPESLPWHRVLGKKDARRGQISIDDPDHAALQRALLEHEGVELDESGFVPLRRFGWVPGVIGPAAARRPPARRPRAKPPVRDTRRAK